MSEQKEKRPYMREFKMEAVRLYQTSKKSMRGIEQELGITPYFLSKRVQQFREQEAAAARSRNLVARARHPKNQ